MLCNYIMYLYKMNGVTIHINILHQILVGVIKRAVLCRVTPVFHYMLQLKECDDHICCSVSSKEKKQ